MKSKKENGFVEYCLRRKKKVAMLIAFAILSTLGLYILTSKSPYNLLAPDGGLVSIDLSEIPDGRINLEVRGELGDAAVQRRVTIKRKESAETEGETAETRLSDSEMVSMEVSRIVRDINRGSDEVVELPSVSPDGVRLTWTLPKKGDEFLLPLIFPFVIMLYAYRGERDKKLSEEKKEKEKVIRKLPAFNNKLVLLMESGLIYEEAIERICRAESEGVIEGLFLKAVDESKLMNGHADRIVGEYAREKKIAELSRFVSIVTESRERGTDLREKLISEGEILWDKRKRQAEELGKLADTKLAFPLGMMLISLLLVTAAPALIQF